MKKLIITGLISMPFFVLAQLKTVYQVTPNHTIGSLEVSYINSTFYFPASDQNNPSDGVELFKSDSTSVGTVLVKDINTNSYGSSNPQNFNS